MKRIIALLLALALAVSMVGCKQTEEPSQTTTSTAPSNPEGPVEFKSYTVTDEEAAAARQEIAATVGDVPLTNGVLQLSYWMGIYAFMNSEYGAYPSLYGLDYTKPLDEQESLEKGTSWQEFFLEDALSTWHLYQAMASAAAAAEIPLSQDLQAQLEELPELLAESAKKEGFDSVDAMIQADAGTGCIGEDYITYTEAYYRYLSYVMHITDTTEVTQADIDAYFAAHEKELSESKITKDSGNVYGVRHILIEPKSSSKDENGKAVYTDEDWEACRVEAQSLLDQWAAGEATEDSFAKLAGEHSTDPGSKDNGGLYEDLDKDTNFVEPFKDWYLDKDRQVGDTGLVKTDYGYHIMYLSSMEAQWIAHCRDSIISDAISEVIEAAQEDYPLSADYDKIVLGEVKLVEES